MVYNRFSRIGIPSFSLTPPGRSCWPLYFTGRSLWFRYPSRVDYQVLDAVDPHCRSKTSIDSLQINLPGSCWSPKTRRCTINGKNLKNDRIRYYRPVLNFQSGFIDPAINSRNNLKLFCSILGTRIVRTRCALWKRDNIIPGVENDLGVLMRHPAAEERHPTILWGRGGGEWEINRAAKPEPCPFPPRRHVTYVCVIPVSNGSVGRRFCGPPPSGRTFSSNQSVAVTDYYTRDGGGHPLCSTPPHYPYPATAGFVTISRHSLSSLATAYNNKLLGEDRTR